MDRSSSSAPCRHLGWMAATSSVACQAKRQGSALTFSNPLQVFGSVIEGMDVVYAVRPRLLTTSLSLIN